MKSHTSWQSKNTKIIATTLPLMTQSQKYHPIVAKPIARRVSSVFMTRVWYLRPANTVMKVMSLPRSYGQRCAQWQEHNTSNSPFARCGCSSTNVSIFQRGNLRTIQPHGSLPRVPKDEQKDEDDTDGCPLDTRAIRTYGDQHSEDGDECSHCHGAVKKN